MIYIVIPVFNRLNYTAACLQSLVNQNYKQYKILLVDHGSTDGTSEYVSANFPDVDVLTGDNSMWWTAATNLGVLKALEISVAHDDFILTLNNDLVVEESYLSELLNVYEKSKPCLVGSVSVHEDEPEKVEFAGLRWNQFNAKFKASNLINKKYAELKNQYECLPSDLLSGRGTLIPVKAFKDLGLFDEENFPHYAGDEDFTLRCKNNGYKLVIAVKAFVKSHVKDTGLNFTHAKIPFSKFIETLSSIRSANNLKIRYRWAKKNAPLPYLYYIFDIARIWGSYIKSNLK